LPAEDWAADNLRWVVLTTVAAILVFHIIQRLMGRTALRDELEQKIWALRGGGEPLAIGIGIDNTTGGLENADFGGGIADSAPVPSDITVM
jgi:hypothetical protein